MESGEDERVGLRLRGLGYSRARRRMVKAVAAWAGPARASVARGQKVACLGKGDAAGACPWSNGASSGQNAACASACGYDSRPRATCF